jgi:hypothetical protein
VVDKGKLTTLLQSYIENVLTDRKNNKELLIAQGFGLPETTGELYGTGEETTLFPNNTL